MFEHLLQLIILFTVIFDPFVSLAVFCSLTSSMKRGERNRTAALATTVAAIVSFVVLVFGEGLLQLFSTNINDFRVSGGIILGILGIKMALGRSLVKPESMGDRSGQAIATIIGTPLLTGPAAITAIIVSVNDYGRLVTGIALFIVLTITAIMLFSATATQRLIGPTAIKVVSTVLGLITISWAVKFIREGLGV